LVHEALFNQLHCSWLWKFYSSNIYSSPFLYWIEQFLWSWELQMFFDLQKQRTNVCGLDLFWALKCLLTGLSTLSSTLHLQTNGQTLLGQLSTNMGEYENAQLIIINIFWLKSFPLLKFVSNVVIHSLIKRYSCLCNYVILINLVFNVHSWSKYWWTYNFCQYNLIENSYLY
jgi:hypothetical protein